ncbi:beta-1,6-N-acetylglucosaminyltransferase [Labrenzia sp. CE80]|uniref:beta-1,6-N-acetylglucosaminyltransferase n=1 Tax=Labrenzia sp. CE80 TaxID=1788986 RepID=UPI00129A14DB|nr:beta-1,6-N-acetylglucosaminyltransferase [Labrenzia sp. CE80]
MTFTTFILLAHERSEDVAELITALIESDPDCHVVVHYDAKSSDAEYQKLRDLYQACSRISFVEKRVACGWGEFGLVEATVRALRLIRDKKTAPGHVYLLSGSCMPVRPLAELRQFLSEHPTTEFIESESKEWMTGGLRDERHWFWFPFGFKRHPFLFHQLTELQKKLRVRRRFPAGLQPRFGSQWWCLTWETCEKIVNWIDDNPRGYRFFRTVWIPDECFFQTLVWKFARKSVTSRPLTFYRFNTFGKPLVFHEGHQPFLTGLPYFFARKISHQARGLRDRLKSIAAGPAGALPAVAAPAPDHLSYKNLVASSQARVKSGQLFHPSLGQKPWPGNLANYPGSFAVLFGPPVLTRLAGDLLRKHPGITVLGRLLQPGEVDFGEGIETMGALRRDDAAIRDLDPALYLTRVFARTSSFPVFELAPTDAPELLPQLSKLANAILLPVRPASNSVASSSLFWLLSLLDQEKAACYALAALGETPAQQERQKILQMLIEDAFPGKLIASMNTLLFQEKPMRDARLIAPLCDYSTSDTKASLLEFRHGSPARALGCALTALDQDLVDRSPSEITNFLEPYWQRHFEPLWRLAQSTSREVQETLNADS